jgi:hypothetical protein
VGQAFALLHSPLVGPSTWAPVAQELRRRGHVSAAPALGESAEAAPYWQRHAGAFANSLGDLSLDADLVLVAHSGAGPLLPAVRAELPRPIGGYLFVDAGLPRHRASRLDLLHEELPAAAAQLRDLLAAGGRYPTWEDADLREEIPDPEVRRRVLAEQCPRGLDFWTEAIEVPRRWPDAPCAYLRLTAGYGVPAAEARRRGWPVRGLTVGHFHMLVDPPAIADALLDLCRAMRTGDQALSR